MANLELIRKNFPAIQEYCKKLFEEKKADRLKWRDRPIEEKLAALDDLKQGMREMKARVPSDYD